MKSTKPFDIPKRLIWDAYHKVKVNGGSAGVDSQSLLAFDENRNRNLYKIWNRLSSGSYFPPPVKAVPIPKKSGGTRTLGIPTVSDRIAQTVIKLVLENELEPHFHENSYGYRPHKSAHDAIAITRKRCWRYDWGIEFDIVGCFDNISHELLEKALQKHTQNKWILLYIGRWLKAPLQDEEGNIIPRNKGIPQGGVVSPLLMNLFLHYVFDKWMEKYHPAIPFCRFADDGLVHCVSQQQAIQVSQQLKERFAKCGLDLHPQKTKIFYCQDVNRKQQYDNVCFDFLGYTFRPRMSYDKYERRFVNFLPGVSRTALKVMKQTIRSWKIQLKSDKSIEDISRMFVPVLRGWSNYYGHFYKSAMTRVWKHFDYYIMRWTMHKYKRFRGHKTKAVKWLRNITKIKSHLFPHWKMGFNPWAG